MAPIQLEITFSCWIRAVSASALSYSLSFLCAAWITSNFEWDVSNAWESFAFSSVKERSLLSVADKTSCRSRSDSTDMFVDKHITTLYCSMSDLQPFAEQHRQAEPWCPKQRLSLVSHYEVTRCSKLVVVFSILKFYLRCLASIWQQHQQAPSLSLAPLQQLRQPKERDQF